MGYSLVAKFDNIFYEKLNCALKPLTVNKVPFGRYCDRYEANKVMKHHMTFFHWGKNNDNLYLPLINKLVFSPFKIIITDSNLMYAEEGSLLLYFSVKPTADALHMIDSIQNTMGTSITSFFHITLAVSQNHQEIVDLKGRIDNIYRYPFEANVIGLELYHIWKPVELVKCIE